MSEIVKWIKTGQRGARAEFTASDFFTALLLISNEPMGRYRLQNELAISDSSTKSLLNFCKTKGLLKATAGRKGHSLESKGERIVNILHQYILEYNTLNIEIFNEKNHYFVVFTDDKQMRLNLSSWKVRDIALAYGAKAILYLEFDKDNQINFPEKEIDVAKYYPRLQSDILKIINTELKIGNKLLIVAADSIEIARKSAIITAIHSSDLTFDNILEID